MMEPWILPHTRKSWRRMLISSSIHAQTHLSYAAGQRYETQQQVQLWMGHKQNTWNYMKVLEWPNQSGRCERVITSYCNSLSAVLVHNQQLSLRAITFSQRPGGLGLLCKWSLDLHYEMQTWQICNKQDIRKRPNTFWLHCLFSCQMAESQFTATAGNTASHRLHCSGESCEYVNSWLLCGNTDIPATFQGNYYEELHIITHTELR